MQGLTNDLCLGRLESPTTGILGAASIEMVPRLHQKKLIVEMYTEDVTRILVS